MRRKYYSAKRRAIMLKGDDIRHIDIFERDEWVCGICREPIDRRLRGDAYMRATLDHIIPLCRGGTHTYDNTQAAHWRCNMLKGDTLPDEEGGSKKRGTLTGDYESATVE